MEISSLSLNQGTAHLRKLNCCGGRQAVLVFSLILASCILVLFVRFGATWELKPVKYYELLLTENVHTQTDIKMIESDEFRNILRNPVKYIYILLGVEPQTKPGISTPSEVRAWHFYRFRICCWIDWVSFFSYVFSCRVATKSNLNFLGNQSYQEVIVLLMYFLEHLLDK